VTDAAGPLLFARYAYPPNALGLCGSDMPGTLLEYGDELASDGGLAELARTFDGAWPYLTLIAAANRIEDPLDARVVEAYWVGNELLEQVQPRDLVRHLDERFGSRLGSGRERLTGAAVAGAVPHHCFHVFAVYPWVGLMRTGTVEEPLHILDQCRTTPGVVQAVRGDSLQVVARSLRWDGSRLRLGPPSLRTARWREGGRSFVPRPRPGDLVSLHWGFVCDVLSPRSAARLLRATKQSLAAVNETSATGAALA
jgi:Family of unknown function (DUF6390)